MTGKESDILLLRLLKYIRLIPLEILLPYREYAGKIIGKIDAEDTVFISTALAFNCHVWSDDKHFKKQKFVKIITTKEIIQLYKKN